VLAHDAAVRLDARVRTLVLVLTLVLGRVLAAAAADPTPAASGSPAGPTVTTASGLKYVDLVVGSGPTPKPGEQVAVHYTISLGDKVLAGSRSGTPFVFALDRDQALKGLNEGVSTMKAGGRRKLIVPPALGYGSEGVEGRVPPNATLDVDVELVEIKK
jgi:peptidylprolyl isomerase